MEEIALRGVPFFKGVYICFFLKNFKFKYFEKFQKEILYAQIDFKNYDQIYIKPNADSINCSGFAQRGILLKYRIKMDKNSSIDAYVLWWRLEFH